MKAIELYHEAMRTGRLPKKGLCCCLPQENIEIFTPTWSDCNNLLLENKSAIFWGSDLLANDPERLFAFSPLRQTIVLFIAAMNEEY